jgi:L-aminopeptidase/D-esterase-like protein
VMTPAGAITDVAGVLVGQHHRIETGWSTGVTVIIPPVGTVGAVDVRGGGPGTRETDLLDPSNMVQHVDAIALCGGSAYGLAAVDGVVRWLGARGRGLAVTAVAGEVVPIVPAAVLFDLPLGVWGNVPDAAFGTWACELATAEPPAEGSAGAGAGATAGPLKGGIGTASMQVEGSFTVAALAAVNPLGSVVNPSTGMPWLAGDFGLSAPDPAEVQAAAQRLASTPAAPKLNTTLGVVVTDAALTKAECRRLAMVAHDGLARAVWPAHSLFDGDTAFALATGAVPVLARDRRITLNALFAAGADVFGHAVVRGVLAAESVAGVPAYRDLYPSALR